MDYSNTARLKRLISSAIAFGFLLIIPACSIPFLRSGEQGPDLPDSFNGVSSDENSSQLGVDEFYHDSTLTQLIDVALSNNRELKILEEEVQVAQNEIMTRRGAYLPFVTFGAETGLDRNSSFTPLGAAEELEYRPGKRFPDPVGNFAAGFNLFWAIDIWRELRNARDAAEQRYIAACERRNAFIIRMVAEIAESYYELIALDVRLLTLDNIIEFQEQSHKIAVAKFKAGRGTELPVQRFLAEVRKNQSEKLIIKQEIVETENRINFLLNRVPQPVDRKTAGFFDLKFQTLSVGVPSQLLLNRPDIRKAEREMTAAGLDVLVARAHFLPRVDVTAGVGYQAFNPRFLFNPEALAYNLAGNLVAPVINRQAIKAEYYSANARQLQALYDYQRLILNAYTEVINGLSKIKNYSKSIDIKQEQLKSLEASVAAADKLFQNARIEYVEVLLAQRDLLEVRTVLIQTKLQQLAAIIATYRALGGGLGSLSPAVEYGPIPVPPAPVDKLPPPPAPEK